MADPRIIIGLLAIACEAGPKGATDLAAARRESRASAYVEPSRAELDGAFRLFEAVLAPRPDMREARALAAALELEVVELEGAKGVVVVREIAGARRGRGFFAFRLGRKRPLAIEAPHSFTDRYTGPIAERLFVESGAAAAAWNTVSRGSGAEKELRKAEEEKAFTTEARRHGGGENREGEERHREREGEREEEGKADLAHLSESFFQEFTRAFARAHADGIVLQLHGFDADARGEDGPFAIVSDATRRPAPWVSAAAGCLGDALARRVALYPRDAGELGGTSNAQAKLLRALGSRSFLHLELSLELRAELAREVALRKRLLDCIPETVP